MGFLSRLFGDDQPAPRNDDQQAIERYRYLLRTAPPERIEQVHREAFAQLTPQQRQLLFDELRAEAPAGEAPVSTEPDALATAATRSELRQPGTVERALNSAQSRFTAAPGAAAFGGGTAAQGGGGMSFGSTFASSMLGSVAGYVIGSAIMSSFLPMFDGFGGDAWGADSADAADAADASGGDFGGADFGGDFGGFDV
jgi:hypothetical protein